MARTRPPQDPPGLGGVPNGEQIEEHLANSANSADSPGTNRQHDDQIPWSGTGDVQTREKLETLWSEFLDQNAVVEQVGGQVRALEQALAQSVAAWQEIRNAVLQLQQRLDALARQTLNTNNRMAALQIASGIKETPEKTVERAKYYVEFLLGDLVTMAQEKRYESTVLDADPTQH